MDQKKFREVEQILEHSDVAARLPAQNLKRAKAFYADKLGLTPTEERPGGLHYQCGNGSFFTIRVRRQAIRKPHSDGMGGQRY